MTTPSAEEREEWRALAEGATEGPWACWWVLQDGRLEVFVPNGTMDTETILEFKDHMDCEECIRPTEADAAFIAAAREAVPALLAEVERMQARLVETEAQLCATRAKLDKARGDHGGGWFWSQAEWSDWSNDLARIVPEEYHDDVAQEAIIERALGDLAARANEAEAERDALKAELANVKSRLAAYGGVVP